MTAYELADKFLHSPGYRAVLVNAETKCWIVIHDNPDQDHADLKAEVWGADTEEEAIAQAKAQGSWA